MNICQSHHHPAIVLESPKRTPRSPSTAAGMVLWDHGPQNIKDDQRVGY